MTILADNEKALAESIQLVVLVALKAPANLRRVRATSGSFSSQTFKSTLPFLFQPLLRPL
jgi:hypothetical protein